MGGTSGTADEPLDDVRRVCADPAEERRVRVVADIASCMTSGAVDLGHALTKLACEIWRDLEQRGVEYVLPAHYCQTTRVRAVIGETRPRIEEVVAGGI